MAETPQDMEKIAEREALKQRVESARHNIEQQMRDMAQTTTNAAGEVGLVKSLWNVMQERRGKMNELVWKDLKATAAGALSVIPLVGEAGTVAKLGSVVEKGKTAVNVARGKEVIQGVSSGRIANKEILRKAMSSKARGELWAAMKEVPRNPVHLISDPLKSGKEAWNARGALKQLEKAPVVVPRAEVDPIAQASKVVLEKIKSGKIVDAKTAYSVAKKQLGKDVLISTGLHIMNKIDPFPDVPPALTTIAGFAEFVLPGANIVPALWQLGHNKIEWVKTYGGMALDMGKVVMNRFDRKLNGMKEPQAARAAAEFHYG